MEKKRVLLVDDNSDTVSIYSRHLLRAGYQVDSARDGIEALDRLYSSPLPDLILLDIMMPKMDGYQLMEKLRGDPTFSQIPIIILSARVDKEAKVRALSLGASDFMPKPIFPDQLTNKVRELEKDELIRTAKAIAALVGISDETLLKRRKESFKTDSPMPIWQDGENGPWCAYKREFLGWFYSQRRIPR